MHERKLYITEKDYQKLEEFIDGSKISGRYERDKLSGLEDELENLYIVSSVSMPPNVVTLNSRVRFRDLDSNIERILTLVFPGNANLSEGRISVSSPIGTAILGYAVGDIVQWKVHSGTKNLRIEEVIYQPEASGDYHL
jgi:regulator of nucleoside diphosphate kinase